MAMAIKSFKDRDTEALWRDEDAPRFRPIARQIRKRLHRLDAAQELADLTSFPGNRLHRLHGDREGQYAIRINDQWRVCFRWADGALDVEIVDYH